MLGVLLTHILCVPFCVRYGMYQRWPHCTATNICLYVRIRPHCCLTRARMRVHVCVWPDRRGDRLPACTRTSNPTSTPTSTRGSRQASNIVLIAAEAQCAQRPTNVLQNAAISLHAPCVYIHPRMTAVIALFPAAVVFGYSGCTAGATFGSCFREGAQTI